MVAEVVPHDGAAGTQHARHLAGHLPRHAVVEDGREDRERQHEVERRIVEGKPLGIGVLEAQRREGLAGPRHRVRPEIHPDERAGRRAEVEQAGEHLASAAADLEHRAVTERDEARLPEHGAERGRPLASDRLVPGVRRRPQAGREPLRGVVAVDPHQSLDFAFLHHGPSVTIAEDDERGSRDDDAAPALPFVSVVVPARNEECFLGPCLDSVLGQTYPAERMDVLVVENGSTDRTQELARIYAARDSRVRVLISNARNQAEAMNQGIAAATADVIARVDAHGQIASDYLETAAAALARHPRADVVGGRFLPCGQTLLERVAGAARSTPLGVGGGYGTDRVAEDHPVASVQCGVYRRARLVAVGLFDAAMAYGEDEDLHWRVLKAGGEIVLCPALRQRYRPRASLRALARQYWDYGGGRLRVVLKHPDYLRPRHLVPAALVVVLAALAAAAVAVPAARVALAGVLALWGVVLLAAALSAPDVGWRERLLLPLAVAGMHLAYGTGFLWQAVRRSIGAGDTPRPAHEVATAART